MSRSKPSNFIREDARWSGPTRTKVIFEPGSLTWDEPEPREEPKLNSELSEQDKDAIEAWIRGRLAGKSASVFLSPKPDDRAARESLVDAAKVALDEDRGYCLVNEDHPKAKQANRAIIMYLLCHKLARRQMEESDFS